MTLEILVLFLLIIANGIFAASEMAVVSSRKVRLQQLANQGDRKAQAALKLANAPNHFLSTVQVGITLIGILAGAFGGATLSTTLKGYLNQIPLLQPYSQPISFGLVVLFITYLSLVVGELVPKRLALNNPERLASSVAQPMGVLATLASPVVHLLSASTDLIMRLLGVGPSTEPEVTEEEIKVLIEQGTEAGTFEEAEQDLVQRVFRLGDRTVSALMTPRPDIIWLDVDDSLDVNRHKIINSTSSRLPVCQESLDNVLGIVQVSDLLRQCLSGQSLDLTAPLRRPFFVPESTKGFKVLELFKQSKTHIALVVDEYGVIQGLITPNDILVELVGDLPSVYEPAEAQIMPREDGSFLVDGMLPVEEFYEYFNVPKIEEDTSNNYHTMAGFVITQLGRIPVATDHFLWGNFRFEVMDMDGNRVDKVMITPQSDSQDLPASPDPS